MKKIYSVLLILLFSVTVFAQAPEKISYQAVIRNLNNTLLANQNIGMQISILKGSATGSAVYTETQTTTSNANGLISIEIGAGTVVNGTFSTIDWSAGPYFIKTEVDPDGGNSYSIVGTSQLLSVPFAFYAKTAENSVKVDAEASRAANAENTLQLKLDTLVAKQTTYTSLLQGFVGKINSLQSTVTTDSTQIVSLQNSLTTSQATVTQLNTQLAATTQANAASIASLKTQLTAANNKVTALTATLGTKDATITALTAQVADLNTALANAQAKYDADKAAWQQQLDALTDHVKVNTDPNNYDYTSYHLTHNAASADDLRITDPVVAAYFKSNILTAFAIKGTILSTGEITEIGKAVIAKGAALTNAEITALLSGIATTVHPIAAPFQAQIAALQATVTADSIQIATLKATITADSTQIVALTAQVTQLQNSLTASQATVTTLNTQLAATTQANAASIASLKTQLTAANNKVTALTATLGTKDATITALTAQNADLNTALANAQLKNAADKDALQQQIDGLTSVIAFNNSSLIFDVDHAFQFGVYLLDVFPASSYTYSGADTTSLHVYRAAFQAAKASGVYFGSFQEVKAIALSIALNLVNAGTANKTDFYTLYNKVITTSYIEPKQAVDSSKLSVYKTAIAAARTTKGSDLTLDEVKTIIGSYAP